MQNASVAPSVAEQIETGVPSAVPNSSPLAAASTGPGKRTTVSAAETRMKTSGAPAPKPSTHPRTRPAEIEPEMASTRTNVASAIASPPRRTAATRRVSPCGSPGTGVRARSTAGRRTPDRLAPAPGVELGLGRAELGHRRVAVDPLTGDPVPVARRAQLRHDGQREHLEPAAEEMVGRQRLVAHLAEVPRARIGHLDDHLGRDLGIEPDLLVAAVPPCEVVELLEDALLVVVRRVADEAAGVQEVDELLALALDPQALRVQLELRDRRRDSLEEPEVEERHLAVVEQHAVARVRVARELVVAVHAAEVEAEDDLGDPVALVVRKLLHLLEAAAGDVLADDHPLVRERRDDVGDDDERVAAVDPRERPLVLGLELVVELLVDPRADLGAHRLRVEPRRDRLHEPQDHPEVLHVGPYGRVDARVLDLDRDVAPVVEARAVDLADRGGGDRHGVEGLEDVLDLLAVLLLDDLLHVLEGDLRRGVAQLGELGLELLAVLGRDEADVEERHHLPELHRRALHGAQGGDDLLGGLDLTARERLVGALLVAGQVGRARTELARGLLGRQPPDGRGAPQARGRDRLLRHGGQWYEESSRGRSARERAAERERLGGVGAERLEPGP